MHAHLLVCTLWPARARRPVEPGSRSWPRSLQPKMPAAAQLRHVQLLRPAPQPVQVHLAERSVPSLGQRSQDPAWLRMPGCRLTHTVTAQLTVDSSKQSAAAVRISQVQLACLAAQDAADSPGAGCLQGPPERPWAVSAEQQLPAELQPCARHLATALPGPVWLAQRQPAAAAWVLSHLQQAIKRHVATTPSKQLAGCAPFCSS